ASCWVPMIVRNRNPGPPESESSIPPVPVSKLATVPANRPRLVPAVLSSNAIFRTALAVVSTGIPVTRYFPLLPTVPVMVIMNASDFMRLGPRGDMPTELAVPPIPALSFYQSVGGCEVAHTGPPYCHFAQAGIQSSRTSLALGSRFLRERR